ncbi:MAG: UDP-3-O-acyl-N-acetylglucosamine deacetylase [Gemmataceae bacterium]|nr:UDP-3-O-acyl-N-acetylglucosamine deacetylase [Gemmataceae bacterium]
MRLLGYRPQRTIGRPAGTAGIGFITGKDIEVRFKPAPLDTGVVFMRTDRSPHAPRGVVESPHAERGVYSVPARVEHVSGTQRRTSLGHGPLQIGLVEHVLAALVGLRIDNCLVELNAPEPPGMDGSALGFARALQLAGVVSQPAKKPIWTVDSSVVLRFQDAAIALHPPKNLELRVSYLLNYGMQSPIHPQIHTRDVTPESFAQAIAGCRTFLLEDEALELRRQGLGPRTTYRDLLVFGRRGPIDNRLRFADEPARHKVLDILGDFALLGHDVRGHIVAYRTGHPHNIELVKELSTRLAPAMLKEKAAA